MSANRRPWDESWEEDHAWVEKWMPKCPDGKPQRVCEILGFRLKAPDYLQLQVLLMPPDLGVEVESGQPLPMYIPRWGTGEPSLYVLRPPGRLWPPETPNDSGG